MGFRFISTMIWLQLGPVIKPQRPRLDAFSFCTYSWNKPVGSLQRRNICRKISQISDSHPHQVALGNPLFIPFIRWPSHKFHLAISKFHHFATWPCGWIFHTYGETIHMVIPQGQPKQPSQQNGRWWFFCKKKINISNIHHAAYH